MFNVALINTVNQTQLWFWWMWVAEKHTIEKRIQVLQSKIKCSEYKQCYLLSVPVMVLTPSFTGPWAASSVI